MVVKARRESFVSLTLAKRLAGLLISEKRKTCSLYVFAFWVSNAYFLCCQLWKQHLCHQQPIEHRQLLGEQDHSNENYFDFLSYLVPWKEKNNRNQDEKQNARTVVNVANFRFCKNDELLRITNHWTLGEAWSNPKKSSF